MVKRIWLCVGIVLFACAGKAFAAQRYSETLCKNPLYDCITAKKGDNWQSLWPNERERDLVMRLNRMNVKLSKGMKIAVPKDLVHATLQTISPFPLVIDPPREKLLIYDPQFLAWAAYNSEGILVKWGPGSAGANWCSDIGRACHTKVGEFRIAWKRGVHCKSRKYPLDHPGAPMPYCMFFYDGTGFHGSPEVPGYNASHGCIRIFVEDAKWLNEVFIELPVRAAGARGTRVLIQAYR